MVIVVVAEPERALVAVKVTLYVPCCPAAGVQLNVPEVKVAFAENVPPAVMAVPVAVRLVIASPSGSDAVTVKLIGAPTVPEAVGGAVTTGGRSVFVTVIVVVAEPLRAFDAVKVTL